MRLTSSSYSSSRVSTDARPDLPALSSLEVTPSVGCCKMFSLAVSVLMSARACFTIFGIAVSALRSTVLSCMEKPERLPARFAASVKGPSTRLPTESSMARAASISAPYAVWSRKKVHCGRFSSSRSPRVDDTSSLAADEMSLSPPQPSAVLARFSLASTRRLTLLSITRAEMP